MSDKNSTSRTDFIKQIVAVPAAAAAIVASAGIADAADNKKQFKYQNTPKGAAKCSGCRYFKSPHGCTIVTGTIAPTGWCIAYAPKSH